MLANVTLKATRLAGATLDGVSSGRISGRPASLPTHWKLVNGYLVGPRANLKNANLRSSDLTNANLTATHLTGAFFTASTLTGVTSGRITGTPSSLPTHWQLVNGYLVGPRANLAGAALANTDLTGADLTGANSTARNLTGATLTTSLRAHHRARRPVAGGLAARAPRLPRRSRRRTYGAPS